MVTPDFDLFGNAWEETPRKRGRPQHAVTGKTRNRVSMLVALGWANPRIAATIGITLPTLHKYYFYELRQRESARDRLEARRLELAWEMAEKGNVGAFKEFGRLLERNDMMQAESRAAADDRESRKPSAENAGKKAVQQQVGLSADAALMAELDIEAGSGDARRH